jgi:hypothetical protein
MTKQFFDYSYGLDHVKLDISGPKGNVFYLLSAIKNLVKQVEGWEASKGFAEMAMGTACNAIGFNVQHDYNTILRYCKEKTGVTFVANSKIGELDDDLYEVRKRTDDVWL